MSVQRILFPTDFSESADLAMAHALFYAEHYDAELHILHSISWHEPESIMSSMHKAAEQLIDEALGRHRGHLEDHFRVIKRTMVGNATSRNLLGYAEDNQIDLIIMGTHGRGLRHFLLGSVAEEVVRLAKCPVMTLRAGMPRPPKVPERILLPFDFSEQSRCALRSAVDLALEYEAKIHLIHVVQDYYYCSELSGGAVSVRDLMPDIEEKHCEQLKTLVSEIANPDLKVEVTVEMGAPVESVVRIAKDENTDLIVMGSHGRSGLSHMLLGSTTERVVRLAPCGVYAVKCTST